MELKKHCEKVKSNEQLLKHIEGQGFKDWEITILFYASLHKMHAYLHFKYQPQEAEIDSHFKIKKYLVKIGRDDLHNIYLNLQKYSNMARYDFSDSYQTYLLSAKERYAQLKKVCAQISPIL